ncbi:predicted protein [Aspergillus nidulans FGSC A4]|uniref:Uncharacterized protein n=1 Tax=Emericella nidulans (strain FGSC A4 / ATCC 38163 / CBS 112.46 / NRRL 194 / M139) TaxID=227321 RepID=Q5B2Q8_EMENI|nr:hypothetical protein [Aspergillus nidulans FGSC A4]EAA62353.1 predicted protein [Aspergillus nidulans FGSC A4]CBF81010.1 TPA: conserved hypothetical protein [Aspergillus nidulans FGSC A4]|eukprot:XP_662776.1 predicted protein [Aspergillus nidulans FGSC A4]
MAPRPELYHLQTPEHIIFPSELQEYLRGPNPTPARCTDGKGPSVPPPLAYTEFLKALSPVFGSPLESATTPYSYTFNKQLPSPQSLPSTASTTSFSSDTVTAVRAPKTHRRARSGPPTPLNVPRSAVESGQLRRLRMSPSYPYSPGVVDSPKSAYAVRSPYPPLDRQMRHVGSPASTGRSITIQHIVTHTVTLKRVPSLAPPPKGKRRRMNQTTQ